VAITESASRAACPTRGVAGRLVVMVGTSSSFERGLGLRGADGAGDLRPLPRLIESPAANSKPCRRSSEISRQRPSAPTARNDAGISS
jgi:hypothetical protein